MGVASRTVAARWIAGGRVAVNGRLQRDPEHPVEQGTDRIAVDGQDIVVESRAYLMLNKPRGLITSTRDEQGRDTVYRCLDDAALPWLMPVGRLDKASEGLLLFCNDPQWAARVTDPATGPYKTYHVQVDCIPDAVQLERMVAGILSDGERLCARSATILRQGAKNAWLEILLDQGRNREIRRLLAAEEIGVLRLLRIAIGPLRLGELQKGRWRLLDSAEVDALVAPNPEPKR